jgi:hypothetical protein
LLMPSEAADEVVKLLSTVIHASQNVLLRLYVQTY